MVEVMPALRIIAEPKQAYRPRYMCEGRPCKNRAQRFVRADDNPDKYVYPTIEIPQEWIVKLQQYIYIRLTHVTVPNKDVNVTCVHPYPIDTEDINVVKDSVTNSLYFPVTDDEMATGRKSFRFTLYKLTQYQLRTYGPLRLLNSEEKDEQRLEDPNDPRSIIDTYQLGQSRLVFSIAIFQNNQQPPLIYDISSVYSCKMSATTTTANDDEMSVRCSPQRGDWKGGEEVLMVIPRVDKRRAFTILFDHPLMGPRSTPNLVFVDTKTLAFYTPACPEPLTKEKPSLTIPIVVAQNDVELARIGFTYQSVDACLTCNTNKRRLSYTDFEETDDVKFNDLTLNRTNQREVDLSHIRNVINTVRMSATDSTENQYSLFENSIQQGNIDLAIKLIRQTKVHLEQTNQQGETPLLLAAKYNQKRLITAILKKYPQYAQQIDKEKNNLLHLLAKIPENAANDTMENVFVFIDRTMIEFLITGLNQQQQTPEKIARKYNNMEYIDLLTRTINSLDNNE